MYADLPIADAPTGSGPPALLYFGIYLASAADPSAAQLVAGTDGAGSALIASGSAVAPTVSGDFAWPTLVEGLTAGTNYRAAWVLVEGATTSTVYTEAFATLADAHPVWGYVMANGQTAETNLLALLECCTKVRKILTNKQTTDPNTGQMTVFDDDSVSVLLQGDLFEDVAGSVPYRGQGAERRERLT